MSPRTRRRRERTIIAYKTQSFLVRSSLTVDGTEVWLLCRPDGARLQRFNTRDEALFVAGYCDKRYGGSYEAIARHAAAAALERYLAAEAAKSPERGAPPANGKVVS